MSTSKKLYIFGASSYSSLVAHYLSSQKNYLVCGYLIDKKYRSQTNLIDNHSIINFDDFLAESNIKDSVIFSSVGYKNMRARKIVFDKIKGLKYLMPNIICDNTYIDSTVKMGSNNIIMPGVILEPNVTIGDNNVIWSNSTVCHDTTIGDHNFLAANSTIGGGSSLGDLCFMGFSSTISHNRVIANETLISAMSFVNINTRSSSQYSGIPASHQSEHNSSGIIMR